MGFRDPVTSATGVDTGGPGTPSVYMTEGSNPQLSQTFGLVGFRDGFPSDADATITRTTGASGHDGSTTGTLTIDGGTYGFGVAAPRVDLGVSSSGPGSFSPYARVSAPWDDLIPWTQLTLDSHFTVYSNDADYGLPMFRKSAAREVQTAGMIRIANTSFGAGTVMFTYPAGSCPRKIERFPIIMATGLVAVDVWPNGQALWAGYLAGAAGATDAVGQFFSLSGIRFAADN